MDILINTKFPQLKHLKLQDNKITINHLTKLMKFSLTQLIELDLGSFIFYFRIQLNKR
jgi:hypothetical protein